MGLFDLVELMNIFSWMAAMIFYDFSDVYIAEFSVRVWKLF